MASYVHQQHKLPSGVVYHTWKSQASTKPRAIILVQHGFAEYAERYTNATQKFSTQLQSAGFEIWAMDMWGHGASPGARGVTHVGKAIDDHIAVRKLALKEGLPLFLFGHSLGGLVTAGSVTKYPEDIVAVAMTGPALTKPAGAVLRAVAGVGASLVPQWKAPIPRMPPSGLSRIPEQVTQFEDDKEVYHGAVGYLIAATALDAGQSIWSALDAWTVPTLILHGNEDVFCAWKPSEEFIRGIASKDKQYKQYDGAYHELVRDTCAEEAIQDLVTFFDKRCPSTVGIAKL